MSPAQAAHFRLLEKLPRRTHESTLCDPRVGQGQKRTKTQEEQLRRDLLELRAQGKTYREMRSICATTDRVIRRLLRGKT